MPDAVARDVFSGKTIVFSMPSHGSTVVVTATVARFFVHDDVIYLFVENLLPESPITCVLCRPGENSGVRADGVPCGLAFDQG